MMMYQLSSDISASSTSVVRATRRLCPDGAHAVGVGSVGCLQGLKVATWGVIVGRGCWQAGGGLWSLGQGGAPTGWPLPA